MLDVCQTTMIDFGVIPALMIISIISLAVFFPGHFLGSSVP
jgi:hypothetical protein